MKDEQATTFPENTKKETYSITDSDFLSPDFQRNIVSFQLSTIEILNSPESKLNLIDSLVDYSNTLIKDCNSDRERKVLQKNLLKVIHHLVFYIEYQIEYKKAVIHKLGKEIIEGKLRAVETTLNEIFEILGALNSKDPKKDPQEVKNSLLSSLRNIINSITKYLNKKEHLKREINELESLTKSFNEFLPVLLNKLYKRKAILGQSNLICGLIENYKDRVLHSPANEIENNFCDKFKKAELKRSNVREIALYIISTVAFIYVFILVLLLIVVVVAKIFIAPTMLIEWLKNLWSYKYLLIGSSGVLYTASWLYDLFKNYIINKREKEIYLKIAAEFRVVLKRHYEKTNQIYLHFNEDSDMLLSNEEINEMIDDRINKYYD